MSDRLDGWKAIGAYLNRDRTTVMRWARERNLPVHRLPGGKTSTVYASRHELDRWIGCRNQPAAAHRLAEQPAPAGAFQPMAMPLPPVAPVRAHWVALVALAGLIVAFTGVLAMNEHPAGAHTSLAADNLLAAASGKCQR